MASDLLVGLLLGVILTGVFNPYQGVFFYIRELRKQIEFLRDGGAARGEEVK